MKLILPALALFILPSPALSGSTPRQAAPAISVGMAVVDDAGAPVGQVESVEGGDVLVRTDRHQARIPRASLRLNRGRLVLSMTRAQLNAAVDRLAPSPVMVELVPGVTVRGTGGVVAGTIESVAEDHVILRLVSGVAVRLPRSSVGADAEGGIISVTAAELQQMVAGASSGASN